MAASPTARRAGRHVMRMVLRSMKRFLALVPVIRYDGMGPGAAGYPSKFDLQASLFIWVAVLPFLVVGAGAINPWAYLGLIPLLPAGAYFAARRSAAALNSEPLRRREWATRFAGMVKATPATVEGGAPKVRGSFYAIAVAVVLLGFGAALPWLVNGAFAGELSWLQLFASKWALVSWAGYAIVLVVSWMVGRAYGREGSDARQVEALWTAQVAKILDVSVSDFEAGSGALAWSRDQESLTVTVPVAARTRLKGIDLRCELIAPGWCVASAGYDIVELVRVENRPEVMLGRQAMAASDGLVVGVEDLPDSELRPHAARWALNPDTRVTVDRISFLAAEQGSQVVEWSEWKHEAIIAKLSARVVQVRGRLAELLNCAPHAIELSITMHATEHRIETVSIMRAPSLGVDAEKRLTLWKNLIAAIPGGSNGWRIDDDPITGRVVLTYGGRLALRPSVSMAEMLPETLDPDDWARLPLGVGPDGEVVSINLKAGPHTIVAGPTGSGKTVALLQIMASAIARGHQVVLIDPTKGGLDFLQIRQLTVAWATESLEAAQAAMEAIYAEVGRRKAILQEHGEVKWSDLSPEVRERENVHPVLIVIDEFGSLVLGEDVPKGLPKDSPYVVEAETKNAAKSIIRTLTGRIAREARFAGLHLALGIQRPDASILGGELRSNLTSAVQLAPPGKPISREAMTMLIPGDQAPIASQTLADLDDGKSPGLAVVAADGGGVAGFRVAYAPAREIPVLLERLGAPLPKQWTIATSVAAPVFGVRKPKTVEPEVIDLGTVVVDFDFEAAEPAATAFPFSFDD
ncbi:FtsK/SpoIIIE family protein [Cryobacterium flavum]|uniref:FtsK/SpoIIIE family protein n=2 Tax=Cryobacterium flavum TaxID=1424659 RepID=A0A4R8V2R9_9MICO|nr:hypothetical protein E3O21_11670 [Cryobacterium flavum]SDO00275.1 FtsK/SpoIIIE family protein [Cryobacterium flavum]